MVASARRQYKSHSEVCHLDKPRQSPWSGKLRALRRPGTSNLKYCGWGFWLDEEQGSSVTHHFQFYGGLVEGEGFARCTAATFIGGVCATDPGPLQLYMAAAGHQQFNFNQEHDWQLCSYQGPVRQFPRC